MSWRICSAWLPAMTAPSPTAPATTGLAIPEARPKTPPANIEGTDSTTVLAINEGFVKATFVLSMTLSAQSPSLPASANSCCWALY